MARILEEIMKKLPRDATISDGVYEGANIVLYTKNANFFFDSNSIIRDLVGEFKKRIELRPDPSLCLDVENAKSIIEKTIPSDAGKVNILFDPQRAIVVIEAEKPGSVIGKQGEILKEIKKKTLWIPSVRRIPSIKAPLIENIRAVLYENSDYRRKFLNKIGKRIYTGWTKEKREEWVRITVLGAGREVGRSCYLLQTPESKVILDCGINVAANGREGAFPHLDVSEFNISELDAIIVSHPHVDHTGLVPYLYKMGFRGPTYMTEPTRDIASLLCLDMIGISNKEGEGSLYGSGDVKEMVKHSVCLNYEEVSDITPDLRITLYNAGHNLGSSLVHVHVGNGLHNFLYTGDFNFETSNLLASAVTKFPRLESVMMEGTYGSRKDIVPSRQESDDDLIRLINATAAKGGKVLMPILGVGRSQEIMIALERAMREGKIPKMPIYLQGMVWDVTAIHTAYPDFFNSKIRREIFQNDQNPLASKVFTHVGSQKEMREVIEGAGPYIVMATSGMLTGGASVAYFKEFAENPKNCLVLTSYQGVGSLGRRLEEGEREIGFLEGGNTRKQEMLKVNMSVETVKGFSGHSSYAQLRSWVQKLDPKPRKIMVIHGEPSKCLELASQLYQGFRIETIAPKNLETVRLR
jgi:uncharacterized protein